MTDYSPLYFWWAYEWPSIKGNGPEDITALVLVSLCIPAVRHWIARHFDDIKAHVTSTHSALHDKLDHIQRQNAHIIKNTPTIPDDDELLTVNTHR